MAACYTYGYAIFFYICRFSLDRLLALPHRLTTDDVYRGYTLPAETVVLGNTW